MNLFDDENPLFDPEDEQEDELLNLEQDLNPKDLGLEDFEQEEYGIDEDDLNGMELSDGIDDTW